MPSPDHAETLVERLASAIHRFEAATLVAMQGRSFRELVGLLAELRQAFDMDVAFVARFTEGRRVFKAISADADHPEGLVVNGSDPLVDTYCKLVVDGDLPAAIPDVSAIPLAAGMPVTSRLDIKSYLSVPIVLEGGGVFGTLCCFSHQPRQGLGARHVDVLKAVADVIGEGIARDEDLRESLA